MIPGPTATAHEIAAAVRSHAVTAAEVIDHALRSAFAAEDRLNAFDFVDVEGARERANRIDGLVAAGEDPGELAGVPFAVKDLIDQQGLLNTRGSSFPVEPATSTAPCVARLESAGAISIGRTALHEFAFGFSSENHWFGPVRNPWDPTLSPGGSSGGSAAAVGGGIVPFAIGTDTGGSVRVPAALCGVVGLKVTHGRGSLRGVFPLAESLDTVGPIARTVADAAAMYTVMAAHDPLDPWSSPRPVTPPGMPVEIGALTIGVPHPLVDAAADTAVAHGYATALDALRRAGATVVDVELPDFAPPGRINESMYFEVAAVHGDRWTGHPDGYGPDVRQRLGAAFDCTGGQYLEGRRWRAAIRHQAEGALATCDVLATPTVGAVRKVIGDEMIEIGGQQLSYRGVLSRYTSVVNHAGLPAIALPLPGDQRPPASLQLIGSAWSEHRLIEIGRALEDAAIVGTPRPPEWVDKGRPEASTSDID